jgi:hypothetical protein
VKQALAKASMCVFVSEAQRQLYRPKAPSCVIYIGVPIPLLSASEINNGYDNFDSLYII